MALPDHDDAPPPGIGSGATQGRLAARPAAVATAAATPGLHALKLGRTRDGLLLVPPGGPAPRPLLVFLHGAGGRANSTLSLVREEAEARGVALLLPESRGPTWDVIRGGYGPDVAFLDAALELAFGMVPVDPARLAIGGFSDGASYALSLGVANGDLFRQVLAFSPGFAAPPVAVGTPALFIAHGRGDEVLPIDRCSRRLAPRFQRAGYAVRYEEFEGGHVVPAAAVSTALGLLCAGAGLGTGIGAGNDPPSG
jgi:phospholipase/carboxylesterase